MKRALLVGVDHYDQINNLAGCVNDAQALEPLLRRNEDDSLNFDVEVMTAQSSVERVTRGDLLGALRHLFAPGADIALLYFAGHGGKLTDSDSDVWLVTSDGEDDNLGVRFSEVEALMDKFDGEAVVILDCCFSGGAGIPVAFGPDVSIVRSGRSILTASRSDQTAAETLSGRGAFSEYLEGALDGGAADVMGHVTVAGLYAYLSEAFGAWDQRPTFKANVDRLQDIRRCEPRPSLHVLRKLPHWFPSSDHVFPLDPSYEPDAEPNHPDNEQTFGELQKCVSARLVEPVGADHMYFAAMQSEGCRLTPLGRRYRRLAAEGRF